MYLYNLFLGVVLLALVCDQVNSQLLQQSTSTACEGSNLSLACPSGSVLSISIANYGRLLPGFLACPKYAADSFTFCFSINATTTMRDRCNDKERCTVPASNSVFGDPCLWTYKYLHASYFCLPYKRVCEGSTMDITCPAGQNIMIVNANYGRTIPGTEICQYTVPSATTNTNCRAANSTLIVSNQCNYKNNCSISASNSIFGDPCFGTYKYLQVTYYCA